ncbi:lipase [Williamsia sp.]|uniref:esterase/lipase family protein n=1 Tax=Williamsia sp. TaxID=1872085 RepID=UPI001A355AE8|nr:lipase [Williamsia sp.]MBJ7291074.1 lipase [Williamsia sp.]
MRSVRLARALVLLLGTTALMGTSAVATAAPPTPAPTSTEAGPGLRVSSAAVAKALDCSSDLTSATRDPVLLTPAFSTDAQSYSWNYLRQLPAVGVPTCSLNLPDHGFGDLQISAEYVVAAVRRISRLSHRKVALIGHQHGALNNRWALTFWPDLADLVSDYISMATPQIGGAEPYWACSLTACPAAVRQISVGSAYLNALNGRPLPKGPGYTSIGSQFDWLMQPQPLANTLVGGTSITLQNICPFWPIEHFTILGDNLTYELVIDALTHTGAAKPNRLAPGVCTRRWMMPGVLTIPSVAGEVLPSAVGAAAEALRRAPATATLREPRLRAYALPE